MFVRRYLDPKNDVAFKKIFGQEKHKEIPIAFLNAVFCLKEQDRIIDLEFINVEQPPEIEARKESIVDVLVRDQKGDKYIIEMQVAKVANFEKRAQFYAAKTYCSHFNAGEKYANLKRVVFLAITSYVLFPAKEAYKSDHVILDNKTYEHDLKGFSFTFVELPKFTKTIDALETLEDKWYYFLKHTDENSGADKIIDDSPEIQEAYHVLEHFRWSEGELFAYERAGMAVADYQGGLEAALKEGLQQGLEQGLQQGLEQGQVQERQKWVQLLLKKGFTEKDIRLLA